MNDFELTGTQPVSVVLKKELKRAQKSTCCVTVEHDHDTVKIYITLMCLKTGLSLIIRLYLPTQQTVNMSLLWEMYQYHIILSF